MAVWPMKRILMVLPLVATGCITVDPQPDYRRAAEYIAQSTGQGSVLPSDDVAIVEQRVARLSEDGISLNEAVEICLLNYPAFQAAWMDVGMARADLVQSGLLSNPSVGVVVRFPSGGGLANVEASLAQNIAELWQLPVRKQGAEHALNQAILRLAQRASELSAKTRVAYYRAAGADRSYTIAQENLAIARQLFETALARRQAGAGSELDVNLARSSVLEVELSLETDRLDRAEARRELARFLGLTDKADDLLLTDSLLEATAGPLDAERMIEAARRCRLDIQAARENVAMAAAAVEREKLSVLSMLEVGVAMERGERRPGDPKEPTDLIVGPTVDTEIPIFDQNQAQIAKATYAHVQAQHTLDAMDRRMVQDVRSAVDRARTAWAVTRLLDEQFVPLARKNLDLSQESYRAGKTSVLSVLEAQRFLLESHRRSVTAQLHAASATVEVERVVGRPLEDVSATTRPSNEKTENDTQSSGGE